MSKAFYCMKTTNIYLFNNIVSRNILTSYRSILTSTQQLAKRSTPPTFGRSTAAAVAGTFTAALVTTLNVQYCGDGQSSAHWSATRYGSQI